MEKSYFLHFDGNPKKRSKNKQIASAIPIPFFVLYLHKYVILKLIDNLISQNGKKKIQFHLNYIPRKYCAVYCLSGLYSKINFIGSK